MLQKRAKDGLRIQRFHYEKGHTIFAESEPAHWLYFISRGEVNLVIRTLVGGRYTIQRLGPGDLFGFDALLPGAKGFYRSYTADVASSVDAFLIERNDFWRLLEDADFTRQMFGTVCRMMHEGAQRIEYLLVGRGALEKVAGALLCLSRFPSGHPADPTPTLHTTYADIALFIGMREETICQQMKALQRRRAVARENGQGMVLHPEKLRKVMGKN